MADVAQRAGVSVSTVSHVVNGTRFVKEATREVVQRAIRDTGYSHNTIARSLATASTQTFGLAISPVTNTYFAQLVAAIDAAARPAGYTLLIADTHDDPDEEIRVVRALHRRRVDGILLAPVTGVDGPSLRYLMEFGVPTVLVDRCAGGPIDQVGTENRLATAKLTQHLAELGHTRIALVSGRKGFATSAEREAGYRLGLRRAGLPFDPDLVVDGESSAEAAESAVARLLTAGGAPTGLVVTNDRMTIGTMRALARLQLQVPGDVAVVAFDDFEWADLFRPRLTAIAQPIEEIGRRAVDMLVSRLADPALQPRSVRVSPRFVHRNSCGCE
ncbi:MAG: LacI family DNA-binding transcriptional regulator [Actinomycetota bacterium]